MTSITLTAVADGLCRLESQTAISEGEGQPIAGCGAPVARCRGGGSADKPFCDGSCARAEWTRDA